MAEQNGGLDNQEVVRLSDWVRDYLLEHTGEDRFFDVILGRCSGDHPPHAKDIFEKDRLDLFLGTIRHLNELCGDEAAAAKWLFHNATFERMGKDSPFDYIQDGEFDALWLLHDLLEMSAVSRRGEAPLAKPFWNPVEVAVGNLEHKHERS